MLFNVCRLVKPLFDSVVALPLDDPPLALAAAAVLYFLALDVRLNICCFCLELEYMVIVYRMILRLLELQSLCEFQEFIMIAPKDFFLCQSNQHCHLLRN